MAFNQGINIQFNNVVILDELNHFSDKRCILNIVPSSIRTDEMKIPLEMYACPSDGRLGTNPKKGDFGRSSYRAVTGSHLELTTTYGSATAQSGVVYCNSGVRIADIRDGSSNTMVVGECAFEPGDPAGDSKVGAIWTGMRGELTGDVHVSDACWFIHGMEEWTINGTKKQVFGSHHNGGATFALADGSVQFLSETIDSATLNNLADRADGEVLGDY